MKKTILISTILLLPSFCSLFSFGEAFRSISFAQSVPNGINYQAVARDTAGKPLISSNLVVRFTIWPNGSGSGTPVFTETHSPVSTNRYGLFTLVIGSDQSTAFQNIDWALGDKFLEVEIANVGGSGYNSMGKPQMMSVPYALHSKTSSYSAFNWSKSGDSITAANFIGTLNAEDWVIKTNSSEKMRVTSAGNIGLGTATPLSKLDVEGGISIGSTYSGSAAAPANGAIIEGNVGIGTQTPDAAAMLDLNGKIKITGGTPGTNKVLTSDATGLASWVTPDTGTVLSFSADSLAPLFTTTVTNASTSPALAFTLSDAAPYTLWGNNTTGTVAPAYFLPTLASPLFQNQGTSTTVLHGNAAGAPTWAKIVNADIANSTINLTAKVTGVLPVANGGTNATTVGPAGSLPYSNATAYAFSAVGTSGQVLTSGGGGAPTWTTPTTGTVTAVTGITPILSTGGSTPAISVANNSQSSPGVVAAGGSNNNMVWKTNSSGAPGWRNDSSATYTPGTGITFSGTAINSVWTQLGNNIFNNNTANVGIGTPTPSAKLQVVTTGSVEGFNSSTVSGTASLGVFVNFNALNTSAAITAATNGTGATILATNTGAGSLLGNAGNFIISNVANPAAALYAETNGTGSAIFGKNTSTGKAGTFEVLNAASNADALYVNTNGSSSKGINVSHTGAVANSTNYGAYISTTGAGTGATNIAGYFTATGGSNNYAGIFHQGNVGIGTIAPVSKLSVGASSQFQVNSTGNIVKLNNIATSFPTAQGAASTILTNDGNGNLSWAAPASGPWTKTGTNIFQTTLTDNVGIGINAPQANLHVLAASGSNGKVLQLGNGNQPSREWNFIVDGSSNLFLGNENNGTARTDMFINVLSGNVGIGTTSPASKLDVEGGISIGANYSGTTAAPANGAIIEGNVGLGRPNASNKLDVGGAVVIGTNYSISGSIAPLNGALIEGNVGIGTTSPASKLDVEGGISIGANYSGTTAAPANGAIIQGNVGIGTTAPGAGLVVSGSVLWKSAIGIENTGAGMEWRILTDNDKTLKFVKITGSTFTAMTIDHNAGNVGIGTTAPANNARLAIKDGHFQSQQTTAPTLSSSNTNAQSLLNATDVAGNVSFSPSLAAAGSVTITFDKTYTTAPIVILSPTNINAAGDFTKIWVTTSTAGFTINFSATLDTSAHTFSYHVIETQ